MKEHNCGFLPPFLNYSINTDIRANIQILLFSSLLFTVISTALPSDLYFLKLTQPLTVSVKKKGGNPDRKPYPLLYGLRSPYENGALSFIHLEDRAV